MSFDVFLVHFRLGRTAQTPIAPIRRLLEGVKAIDPRESGFYNITFPSGSHVEYSCTPEESDQSMCSGAAFFMRGYDADVLKFMIDAARAGAMVMFPAMASAVCILVSEEQREHLPKDLEYKLVVATTPEELAAVLQGGFDAWRAYRDSVLRKLEEEADPD